jgi:hypothetical protein
VVDQKNRRDSVQADATSRLQGVGAGETPDAEVVPRMQRDLVIAARNGDTEAYSQLVSAACPRLIGVASLILRDADRAQDAVQSRRPRSPA